MSKFLYIEISFLITYQVQALLSSLQRKITSQRKITCYWLEGQTAVMRKGTTFHFRASCFPNTKVSLCFHVLMIHCLFTMPFYFLVTPNTAACHWLGSFLLPAPPFFLQHIIVQLSCYTQAQPSAVVTNICTCGASNTSRNTPTCLPVRRY